MKKILKKKILKNNIKVCLYTTEGGSNSNCNSVCINL